MRQDISGLQWGRADEGAETRYRYRVSIC